MFRTSSILLLVVITVSCVGCVLAGRSVPAADSSIFGDWTGESICQARDSACHDEKVVYHVKPGKQADMVTIDADRITDGKAVDMGALEFTYDKTAQTLVSETSGHWLFKINWNKMDGTLTLANGTLFRKIALTKKVS